MDRMRVLIVDDHPMFRRGVRALVDDADDLVAVGEATTGEEAVVLCELQRPDVVLMDINLPGMNGIETTRHITRSWPNMRVLVLTMFEEDASVFSAMRAGARGYVLKDAEAEDILRAVRAVGRGDAIFSPEVATRIVEYFANPRLAVPRDAFPTLTERERAILLLLANGRSNAEIASELVLSPKSVANYVSNILSKLQVADRAAAILRAREAGLG